MVSRHIRSNAVAYLALFFALTGSAAALQGKNTVKTKDIANNAVTTPKIRGGAVTAAKLAQGSVGAAQLAPGSVGAAQLAAGAVGSSALATGAVGTSALAADAVTLDKIAPGVIDNGILDGAVTTEKLADEAVTTAKLDDEAVTSGQIDDEAVTTPKLDDEAVTGSKVDQPTLDLGPSAFGAMPAVRAAGEFTQTAPAIAQTPVQLDPNETGINVGGFGVTATGITVPIGGIYFTRLVVPWGPDADAADRQFVAELLVEGDLVQSSAERATQNVGFNYGPVNEASGLVELSAGDEISGVVYYSGATPAGGIPLAGIGFTTMEAFWLGPSS